MAHFYLASSLSGTAAVLEGEEARHAVQVARLRVDERVVVGDGRGRVADAVARSVAKDRVELQVESLREEPPAAPRLVLVQALAKGGRDEAAVQASVELGVSAVVPWQSARSVTRWTGAKVQSGTARWTAIVREAGKQAMRPWAAEVLPPVSTAQLVRSIEGRPALVLEPGAAVRLVDAVRPDVEELVLIVGPEGGIAPEELAVLAEAGAVPVRLGPHVLRTSTAGPAALAALAIALDLWP